MKAELITIGDELLYGHTIDTNAAFIGEKLADAGIELVYHTTVGDDPETMLSAFALAMNRCDIILTTGGLGPTHDDITKKVICKYFKRQLVFHEEILLDLEKRYETMGVKMPPINQNQALLPQGAGFLKNKIGSALGIVMEDRGKMFVSMPGVPSEMEMMVTDELLPLLLKKAAGQVIIHRKLRTFGLMESVIFEKVKNIIEEKSIVGVAFLPGYQGVDIRFTTKSDDETEARQAIAEIEQRFTEKIGEHIYGYDNDELPGVVGKLLTDKKMTIAVAESCTGGFLGKLITDIPGSSAYFLGGVIAYSNDIKIKLLNVQAEIIRRHGAVSEQTASYMANGVRTLTGADIGVAITGIAGPDGGTPEKPVGLIYIGLTAAAKTEAKQFNFGKVRERNRQRASYAALDMVRRYLKESN